MPHSLTVRVYYEDTDCMGVVYHGSYIRFLERGRTEWLAAIGKPVWDWNRAGVLFPIYNVNATFRVPARLGDVLTVVTDARPSSAYRMRFEQRVERAGETRPLVEAQVEVVCTDLEGNLREFPPLD